MAYLGKRLLLGMNKFSLIHQRVSISLLNAQFSRLLSDSKQDQGIPKRPRSSYIFFYQDKRDSVERDNPHLHPNQVARIIGEMYKNSSEAEISTYKEKARQESQDYKTMMDSLPVEKRKELRELRKAKQAQRKKRRDKKYVNKTRPARPTTAYGYFLKDMYPKVDWSLDFSEKSRLIRDAWAELSDSEKQNYKESSDQLMKAWKEDYKEWKMKQKDKK